MYMNAANIFAGSVAFWLPSSLAEILGVFPPNTKY